MTQSGVGRAGRQDPSRRLVSDGVAAGSALLVYLMTSGGLFFHAPWLQIPLVAGLVAGLLASGFVSAALVAGAAVAVGAILQPPALLKATLSPSNLVLVCLLMILISAGVAAYARFALSRHGAAAGRALLWVGIALLIGNLWVSALTIDSGRYSDGMSLIARLSVEPKPDTKLSDGQVYTRAQQLMAAGKGFYPAYAQAHSENTDFGSAAPGNVFGFRPPAVFVIRDLMQGPLPERSIIGLLVLASLAILASVLAVKDAARLPLVLISVAALCSYFLHWSTTELVMYADGWAAALGLAAFGVLLHAARTPDAEGHVLYAGGVVLATMAVLSRELMLFLPLAGLVSALVATSERRFRVTAWVTSFVTIAAGLGLHYIQASKWLSDASSGLGFWLRGGPNKLVLALLNATRFLAPQEWVIALLVVAALAGAAFLVTRRGEGLFAAIAVLLPLVGFLFFGNPSHRLGGESTNYWGVIVMPLLLALVPLGFAWLPGIGRAAYGPRSVRKSR